MGRSLKLKEKERGVVNGEEASEETETQETNGTGRYRRQESKKEKIITEGFDGRKGECLSTPRPYAERSEDDW